MTIRQYIAMALGTLAIALGASLISLPAHADAVDALDQGLAFIEETDWADLEPGLTGFHEEDDLPSYMAFDRPDPHAPLSYAIPAERPATRASFDSPGLSGGGMGGLSWDILVRLALLSVLFLAVAFYGGRKNV